MRAVRLSRVAEWAWIRISGDLVLQIGGTPAWAGCALPPMFRPRQWSPSPIRRGPAAGPALTRHLPSEGASFRRRRRISSSCRATASVGTYASEFGAAVSPPCGERGANSSSGLETPRSR